MKDDTGLGPELQAVLARHDKSATRTSGEDVERSLETEWYRGGGMVPPGGPLNPGGGGGKSGPVPDETLTARVDFLHTAFLWLAGALVVAITAVIGISVTLSNSTNSRLDKTADSISAINRQTGEVGVKVDEANRRLATIEEKIDRLSGRSGNK